MKLNKHPFTCFLVIATLTAAALAAKVSTDYDHSANFGGYKTSLLSG